MVPLLWLLAVRGFLSSAPDPLHWERAQSRTLLGTDESGTGAIAGPIVVTTVALRGDVDRVPILDGVDDAKKLSKDERDVIVRQLNAYKDHYVVETVTRSAAQIDEAPSVRAAILDAMKESISSVASQFPEVYSIVDGHVSPHFDDFVSRPLKQADAKVYTVALASIVARHARDLWTAHLIDGGYPTRQHWEYLYRFGPTDDHRLSCPVLQKRRQPHWNRRSALLGLATPLLLTRPSQAMTTDPKTGIALPDVGEIEGAVPQAWEEDLDLGSFNRLDNTDDAIFYKDPRYVEHIDEEAVRLLSKYVTSLEADSILDIGASWTSHLEAPPRRKRVIGLGMNEEELRSNQQLTEWVVRDLNQKPELPYPDESFDAVLCQLTIDYLTKPVEVCREIKRVLRKGGTAHILFSNRLFLSKAVALWTGADDIDHTYTVASYLHWGGFDQIQARDLSNRRKGKIIGDPLYVVTATKSL